MTVSPFAREWSTRTEPNLAGKTAGRIDSLVNCAGYFPVLPFEESLTSGTFGFRGVFALVLGAGTGLVAFGAVARAGRPFAVAGLPTFLPAIPVMGLFWLLPETRGHEPEDLWPDS
jgi:hypothetical protein